MGIKRKHLIISGHVQGVSFRISACKVAQDLNLTGWVRNLADGRVEIIAEGDETALTQFVEWCHQGPSCAKVSKIEMLTAEASREFKDFKVR